MIPLYEAVVNSIQAAEEEAEATQEPLENFEIVVSIRRETSLLSEGSRSADAIEGFDIQDNGVGFNEDNWRSFRTLDTLHKDVKGCRGIGRLMWLKAFRQVKVDSHFETTEGIFRREFDFDRRLSDVTPVGEPTVSGGPRSTMVRLIGFDSRYASAAPKSAKVIAAGILEHCLWYFVRPQGVPSIRVVDGEEDISLADLFDEHMHTSARAEIITIGDHSFEITHIKFRARVNKQNQLNYCAAGRLVKSEPLQGKVAGLAGAMIDEHGRFTYAAYLTSPFLDSRAMSQRIGFHIDDEESAELFKGQELSFKDIRDAVLPRVRDFLSDYLSEIAKASARRLDSYVAERAPRYRPILDHIDHEDLIFDPGISDRELEILLHKQMYRVEQKLLDDGHEILVPYDDETEEAYQARIEGYLERVAALKQADLADYVMHRRVVIDLLEKMVQSDGTGRFAREDRIHELIVPMRRSSTEYEFRRENLWLIDERLAFHNFLASDKTLASMAITEDTSTKEPDIASLRLWDNPFLVSEKDVAPASLTVVEIKRPMRSGYVPTDEDKDPIFQSLEYLSRLRNGAAARGGRPVPNADKIPGFVYVLADLTERMKWCCRMHQLTPTADGMGYFGYHRDPAYNAYIQVISFDGLILGAKERNRAFFDRLGLPSR